MKRDVFCWVGILLLMGLGHTVFSGDEAQVEKWRLQLYEDWHKLPVPPITPYSSTFTPSYVYGSNLEFEKATLDDWKSMGYNASYKLGYGDFRSGRWLKKHGMLGAINQTLWNKTAEGATHYDGTTSRAQPEGCGSFLAPTNHAAGVSTLLDQVAKYGELDMVKIGNVYIICSEDEVGMRTRSHIDYRAEAIPEYRKYLKEAWFQDESPGEDTNKDGRTYNGFTGENLKSWDEVKPPILSPNYYSAPAPVDEKWKRLGAYKLWMDFHRYYTFEFYRRINAEASAKLGEGKRVECYPFPQAFIVWPGANCFWGMSYYWNARLNPIITVEQCWPDSPAMAINYAQTDRLARIYRSCNIGWSWVYPSGSGDAELYDGPGDIERALARMMGRRLDGIHHWLYSPRYRQPRWQSQRKQLAYWHNFLGKHYRSFLSRSAPPVPEVALLIPDYTGYFYRMFAHPKVDYAYTAAALLEAQIPFEIVAEEELELDPDALKTYKVLYVVASEWTTPTIRRRIEEFIAKGGCVFVNADSLSLDIPTGERTDFLAKTFGIKLEYKYKNPFNPSAETQEEEQWAAAIPLPGFQSHDLHKPGVYSKLWKVVDGKVVRDEEVWKKVDEAMAKVPAKGRGGISQSGIDMRQPPKIKYAEGVGPQAGLVTYGEINAGSPAKNAKPIAWYGDKVCGVETERTIWLGTRPGMSLHALAPRISLSRPTEPCNPFLVEVSNDYKTHKPYVDLLAYAARKAGVKPLVRMTLKGEIPCNLEVLPRIDADGNMMVIVVNHDRTDATYEVAIDPDYVAKRLPKGSSVLDLLKERTIEKDTDGKFEFAVEPSRAGVVFVGAGKTREQVQVAQKELNAMNLSVPKYFVDRPELNEAPWETPVPSK